ncbi:MAG: hypothetical protein ACRDGQ_03710 [Candidatus Limnocylindrales bacterium]
MAKSSPKSGAGHPSATKRGAANAFKRAWKLLTRLEAELDAARRQEAKRRRQVLTAAGDQLIRRQLQLDAAIARGERAAGLLTELSELIGANVRAQGRQTVRDIAHETAQAIKAEEQVKAAERASVAAMAPPATLPAAGRPARAASPRPRRSLQQAPKDPGSRAT